MQTDLFSTLIRKARLNAAFLAHSIALFAESRQETESDVMEWLGASETALMRLALSRKPVEGTKSFRSDIETIATFSGANPLKLIQLIRVADSIIAFRKVGDTSVEEQAYRMAARDDGKRKGDPEDGTF